MVELLIIVAMSISLVGMMVFGIAFTLRAPWRTSAIGRHMVYFAWAFSAALLSNLLRILIKGVVIDSIRVVCLFLLAAVVWQRTYLFLRKGAHADD